MRPISLLVFLCGLALAPAAEPTAPVTATLPPGLYAEIGTPRGTITCELFFQKTPLTVSSFVGLAEGRLGPPPRKPYFDGLKFHRVVPNFVVQGGDPTGTGDGGPGYQFPDEFVPGLRHDAAGILSMANTGPDTNGSQFFITHREVNRLNYLHSVFGRVVRGLDVLPKIEQDDTMTIKIVRIGAAAEAFRVGDSQFAALLAQTKSYSAEAMPGPTAHFDDPDGLVPTDPPRAKNFNFKLANFERATGMRIVARLFTKSPSEEEDAKPGAYMKALAEKLGVAKRGALVAYFADQDDWRVWIGDDSVAAFVGGSSRPNGRQIHDEKVKFFASARTKGNANFAEQVKAAGPDRPVSPKQKLKLQTDHVLDEMIFRLEPK